jgi:hypothetical protein
MRPRYQYALGRRFAVQEMNSSPQVSEGQFISGISLERRKKPRIIESFLARVRGVDASGQAFDEHTTLDNLSAGGSYMQMARFIEPGVRLFIILELSSISASPTSALRVAALGEVKRVERRSNGLWGVGVTFKRHRFL